MSSKHKDSGQLYPLIRLNNRYLFPRCAIEIPARYRQDKMLYQGARVVVYTVTGVLGYLFPVGRIATLAEVVSVKDSDGTQMAEIRGDKRVIIRRTVRFGSARVIETSAVSADNSDDIVDRLRRKSQEFVFLININESDRLIYLMNFIHGIDDLTDFISHYFIIDEKKKRILYRETDPRRRGTLLEKYLDMMISGLKKNAGSGQ